MKRRRFFHSLAAGTLAAPATVKASDLCGCAPMMQGARPVGAGAFDATGSKFRITGMKVFGVSLTPDSDRPYVFVKLETNQGVVGWG
ncbi:MAG: galactonate dehydratase, partial [Bryobacterales bacterium]|nr:galactonate dehydratase [Bryobacterales bacterium]